MPSPEANWADRVYDAALQRFSRDPDVDADAISDAMVSAALAELVTILAAEKPRDAERFIRNIIA